VLNKEHYYRSMFCGRTNTWNLRDARMMNTVLLLQRHPQASGCPRRTVSRKRQATKNPASAGFSIWCPGEAFDTFPGIRRLYPTRPEL
jgi:hypothetical protein